VALAILHYEGSPDGAHEFRFDLGTNRYFALAIGEGDVVEQEGVRILDAAVRGPVSGPLPESARGRGTVGLPDPLFDRDRRSVQLWSFRTSNGDGPAVSSILQLPRGRRPDGGVLPPPAFAASLPEEHLMRTATVPIVRERRLSRGMFLGALAGLIPKLIPMAGQILPMLGGLFGGGGGAAGAPAPNAILGGVEKLLADPKTQELIATLLKQLTQASGAPASDAKSLAASFTRSARSEPPLSNAMIAPALLAALPALMPLLEKALNPETIKAITEGLDPSKVIGVVSGALKDFANIGLQANEQNMKWLRSLHPSLNDPAMDKLFEGLSLSREALEEVPRYRRVSSVILRVDGAEPQVLAGRTRVLYRHGGDLGFPLRVESPKPIRDAELEIAVKDPRTLETLSRSRFRYPRVTSGLLDPTPRVPAARLRRIRPGEEVLVCAALTWKARTGPRRGTAVSQLVTLAGGVQFVRVEEGSEVIPLNDVEKHRAFWHKAWQASLTREDRRYELECKYYTSADPEAQENARMETRVGTERTGLWRQRGRLKSGLVLSLPALNALLPRLTPHPSLSEEELRALLAPEFVERFHRAGRTHVDFEGREGDSVALWVYPEMRVHDVILSEADEVDEHGRVGHRTERAVKFLFPVDVHFVGVTTAS
jgi:hypothetical protein